jgi:hypothetical protein
MSKEELMRLFEKSFSCGKKAYGGDFDHDSFLQLRRDIFAYKDEEIGHYTSMVLYEFLVNHDLDFIDSVLRLLDVLKVDPWGRVSSSIDRCEADLRMKPFEAYSSEQRCAVYSWLVYLYDFLESELDRFVCDSAMLYWKGEKEEGVSPKAPIKAGRK